MAKKEYQIPEWQGDGFDLRVSIKHPKTGRILKHQPYRLHVSAEFGHVFERGGHFFFENGVELGEDDSKKFRSAIQSKARKLAEQQKNQYKLTG